MLTVNLGVDLVIRALVAAKWLAACGSLHPVEQACFPRAKVRDHIFCRPIITTAHGVTLFGREAVDKRDLLLVGIS